MQRRLACVAMLLAGSVLSCGKDRHQEPRAAGPASEELTPASGTTEMTPASGTSAPAAGAEPGPELAVTSRGSVILQEDAVRELTGAVCQRQSLCGEGAEEECEGTVEKQAQAALGGCVNGLSRTELYVCLTAIAEKECGASPSELEECSPSSLCL